MGNGNEIENLIQCSFCVAELPEEFDEDVPEYSKIHPQEYQKLLVGFTENGLQVWCMRHDCNVLNIDFEGIKHPRNTAVPLRIANFS